MKEKITEFGNAFSQAFSDSKNNIDSFVWRDQNGENVRMMDMSKDELQRIYNHTTDMLWNKNSYSPGKIKVKENIRKMYDDCNAELLLRYITRELDIESLKTNKDLIELISDFRKQTKIEDNECVTVIFDNLPVVFRSVTILKLINACLDKLGVINKKLMPDKFIMSQGIWLTNEEKEDLTEYDENGVQRSYMDVLKERLFLNNVRLRIDTKGLNFAEFRALVKLPQFAKVSETPTNTLTLLRDKIFLLLDADVDYHINKWTEIKEQIEKVAEYKQITLTQKTY